MTGFTPEDRQMLQDSLTAYLSDRYSFEHGLEQIRSDAPDGFSRADWASYADLGWLGLTIPEEHGGMGGGMTEAGILFAAAGKHLMLEPLVPTLVLGAGAIARMGTDAQKEVLPDIATGGHFVGFCHAEPRGGFDRRFVETIATKEQAGYRLSGGKSFAVGAHAADTLIVSARIGSTDGPVGLFLLPRDTNGLTLTRSTALDGRRGAALTLDGVLVAGDALLGGVEADRLSHISALLDRATLAICAEAVGAMAAVSETTTEYLRTREQFGQKLADFQVLQHRLVDMHILSEEARMMVGVALDAMDRGDDTISKLCSQTKVKVARAARFVGAQGIQLHGGMGMTDEIAVGHYYKRLSVCEAAYGDSDWHMARLAAREQPQAARVLEEV